MTIPQNIFQPILALFFVLLSLYGDSQTYNSNYFPPKNYGGKEQLRKIIAHEVDQRDIPSRGRVLLRVAISEEGKLTSKEIFKSSDDALNTEALRIVDKVLWHPAYLRGEAIEGSVLISIPFSKKHARKVAGSKPIKVKVDSLIDTSCRIYSKQEVDSLPQVIYPSASYSSITDFVLKNFNYPEMAIKYAVQGTTGVEFIIEPLGYVSNVRIYNQLGAGCDVEVAKWINQLYFTPPMKGGKLVRVKMRVQVPIHTAQSQLQVH